MASWAYDPAFEAGRDSNLPPGTTDSDVNERGDMWHREPYRVSDRDALRDAEQAELQREMKW